jgi:hypothetical protein
MWLHVENLHILGRGKLVGRCCELRFNGANGARERWQERREAVIAGTIEHHVDG